MPPGPPAQRGQQSVAAGDRSQVNGNQVGTPTIKGGKRVDLDLAPSSWCMPVWARLHRQRMARWAAGWSPDLRQDRFNCMRLPHWARKQPALQRRTPQPRAAGAAAASGGGGTGGVPARDSRTPRIDPPVVFGAAGLAAAGRGPAYEGRRQNREQGEPSRAHGAAYYGIW